ncbi:2OG-Fe(II) oxygenase family protein [Pseudomonas sp. KFB-139]|uniref:2-oxoglutarate-dependent ethylene/succinate-forming enzyme n=1 Tax=Pseudomonas serbiensis TaxID=3064350 RepID=A0ABT9CI87_9PSED|nr:2OG-Fe(II) oxygenase family protein [Pseudomonas sp. KFB-138]MDO7925200.1 2OG-Fe(II) oxygenase family protein [Pseudomonas sp. KFB-138]
MNENDIYTLASAELINKKLIFDTADGFSRAISDGFFFVKSPGIELMAGDLFARNFYLPVGAGTSAPYQGFSHWTEDRLACREGYFSRDVDQVEQFFLESRFWKTVFPKPLLQQAGEMQDFALALLKAVLAELDLPIELWDESTGRCLSMQGTYHLTFNHFRNHVRARGLNIHKDSGWVTILRSLEPGLEVFRDGEWLPVSPRPGEFIVNFGCAMEILTRHSATPVAAVAHRVKEQLPNQPDRFSYALFVDSSLDPRLCPGLFRYVPGHGLVLEANFEVFLNEILQNTYQEKTQGLY